MDQTMEMVKTIHDALADKKGEDIKVLNIAEVSVLADYFVIAHGNSNSQVTALIDNVQEKMHLSGYHMIRQEGNRSGTWVLLDYGDVVVHVFDKENRSFYNLERIWSDGRAVAV